MLKNTTFARWSYFVELFCGHENFISAVPVNSTVLLAEQVAPTVFVPEVEEITEEVEPSTVSNN